MNRRELLGVGAAACVACCVPLLVIGLGAVASAGLVSALFVGFGGLVVASVAIVALLALRRGRRRRRAGLPQLQRWGTTSTSQSRRLSRISPVEGRSRR